MDYATYAAYYGFDHSYAGDLSGRVSEASDLLDPLLERSFFAASDGPGENHYVPSPSSQLFNPTGHSQRSGPSMARAQPLISLAEEEVGYPGFGYTTGGEPLSDLCEATVENNYGVSNCTTPNATATAFSSERCVLEIEEGNEKTGPTQIDMRRNCLKQAHQDRGQEICL